MGPPTYSVLNAVVAFVVGGNGLNERRREFRSLRAMVLGLSEGCSGTERVGVPLLFAGNGLL